MRGKKGAAARGPRPLRAHAPASLGSNVWPPWLVLIARQVLMLIESRINRTLPSHIDAFTPPVWKLRAPMNRAREVVDVVVHGPAGFGSGATGLQMPPVRTSCSLLL